MKRNNFSLVLRNINQQLYDNIKLKSQQANLSMNKFLIQVIEESLNPKANKIFSDLDPLFGKWSKEEHQEFETNQKDHSLIDQDLWK